MKLIQIIPDLGAAPGGVCDYAFLVAGELKRSQGIETVFITGHAEERAKYDGTTSWKIEPMSARTSDCLHGTIETIVAGEKNPVVLLHYSNYGYQSRGVPFWLMAGIKGLKAKMPELRLITIFHELHAMGWPWQSSFWLSPLQRALAKRVASLSDSAITSLRLYGQILESWGYPREKLTVRPVFSTVGEIDKPVPLSMRKRRLVVFGSNGLRRRLYLEAGPWLAGRLKRLGLDEVVDIGAPVGGLSELVKDLKVREAGIIPASEVSEILADSYAGAIAYPPGFLGKSTIFAAYCAHGVLPLVFAKKNREAEQVRTGERYVLLGPGEDFDARYPLEEISKTAHAWYQGHSLARLAAEIADSLRLRPRLHG